MLRQQLDRQRQRQEDASAAAGPSTTSSSSTPSDQDALVGSSGRRSDGAGYGSTLPYASPADAGGGDGGGGRHDRVESISTLGLDDHEVGGHQRDGPDESDTLSYTDDGTDDGETDDTDDDGTDDGEEEEETEEEDGTTNDSSLQNSYDTDGDKSGLLSWGRRSWRGSRRRLGAGGAFGTDDDSAQSTSNGGSANRRGRGGRARAGSFVSYSARSIWTERVRQSVRYAYELFFPPDDDPWSSPNSARHSGGGHSGEDTGGGGGGGAAVTRRHKMSILFNFTLLALGYCAERSTFKVLVDKAGPFRLFGAEVIAGFHAAVLGMGLVGGWCVRWSCGRSTAATGTSARHGDRSGGGGGGGGGAGAGAGGGGSDKAAVKGLGVPLADVGLMAVLDTAHLLLAVISGSIIPPVLTVVLVQFTIPLTVFITEFIHPKGRCRQLGGALCCIGDLDDDDAAAAGRNTDEETAGRGAGGSDDAPTPNRSNIGASRSSTRSILTDNASDNDDDDNASISSFGRITGRHQCGALLIFLAIVLVISPAVMIIADPASARFNLLEEDEEGVDPAIAPKRSAWNTIIFAMACIPAAASQLYKEHTLAHLHQPVDPNRINCLLSFFQFIFAMIVSPLLYPLQGLANGDNWTALYPSKQTSQNFSDGIQCLITGTLDEAKATSLYPEPAYCKYAWVVALVHVFGIVTVGYAVERIVEKGATRLVHRAISGGFILAIIAMYAYEVVDPSVKYGPISHATNLCAATIVVFGSEMYHSAATAEATFETTYQVITDLYEDEDEE